MKNFQVYTFNVGQGLFNLMIGTKDDDSLYTAVFDCGNFPQDRETHIADACTMLRETDAFDHIDDVVISHQDVDHWRNFLNLMFQLNGTSSQSDQWYGFCTGDDLYDMIKFNNEYVLRLTTKKTLSGTLYVCQNMYFFSDKDIEAEASSRLYDAPSFFSGWSVRLKFDGTRCSLRISPALFSEEQYYYIYSSYLPLSSKWGYSDSLEEIRDGFVDFVSEFIKTVDFHELIFSVIYTFFKHMSFFTENVHDAVQEAVESSVPLNIAATRLYLGGLDCGQEYIRFKKIAAIFADKLTEGQSLLSIYPDSGIHTLYSPPLIDLTLYDGKGHSLSQNGAVYRNATSLVTAVYVADDQFLLFPGDATFHVFSLLAQTLTEDTKMILFLAPHHGSYHTNFALEETGMEAFPQPLSELLEQFPPDMVVISAEHTRFGHPSAFFLGISCEACVLDFGKDTHPVIYCDNDSNTVETADVKKAVYSTESNSVGSGYIPYPPPVQRIMTQQQTGQQIELPPDNLFL